MKRSYYDASAQKFALVSNEAILGSLTAHHGFAVDPMQRGAWLCEIEHLKEICERIPSAHIFLEFMIPRMGRRADVVLLLQGVVFVLEYKVGKSEFARHDIDQTLGYALDLKNFHETSHDRRIVPILIATEAVDRSGANTLTFSEDGVALPIQINVASLLSVLTAIAGRFSEESLDPKVWEAGRYKPTPTIVEAAQALYRGHDVKEISRSEAGAENLSATSQYIHQIIDRAKVEKRKAICFITGVPGSGKTPAGLNIANSRMKVHQDEHAVFLSGNGPLVDVLREALTIDTLAQAREAGRPKLSKASESQKASAFIQNIHHFRDESLQSSRPPVEKVVVFDEAQRAWDAEQTSSFMRKKRGQAGFAMSEPEFLLSVMERHPDWCTVICLIGGGQEINTGEAGITEWLSSLQSKYPHWEIHVSDQIAGPNYLGKKDAASLLNKTNVIHSSALHLAVSIRSFRAEHVSNFVGALLDNDMEHAKDLFRSLNDYPIVVTRSLKEARRWLRSKRRGTERAGLIASSNAHRLKPKGIFMKAKIDPPMWFLAPSNDLRASDALEDAASEFDIQGLELDWTCVCWDANLRHTHQGWTGFNFKGTTWQRVSDPTRMKYLLNSYRVLLTRARQGMVIFVPKGDNEDPTRAAEYYDPIFDFLRSAGMVEI
jgi:hypothetical protein